MNTSTNGRLAALEAHFKPCCPTCRDWSACAVVNLWEDDAQDYPDRCPKCGRAGPVVIRFGMREDGPQ
ncbi:MAG: hypothetical protein ACJ789_05160 [Thermomicrobiales bacterium]